jgi:hypothetical protein
MLSIFLFFSSLLPNQQSTTTNPQPETNTKKMCGSSIDNVMNQVNNIDLSKVKRRVLKTNTQWTEARTDAAIAEYRKFLCIAKIMSDSPIAPCADVDEIWHTHILFTMDYASDCENLFGCFLHHQPLDDEATLDDEWDVVISAEKPTLAATLDAYVKLFGTQPHEMWLATSEDGPSEAFCICKRDSDEASASAALCLRRSAVGKEAICLGKRENDVAASPHEVTHIPQAKKTARAGCVPCFGAPRQDVQKAPSKAAAAGCVPCFAAPRDELRNRALKSAQAGCMPCRGTLRQELRKPAKKLEPMTVHVGCGRVIASTGSHIREGATHRRACHMTSQSAIPVAHI